VSDKQLVYILLKSCTC